MAVATEGAIRELLERPDGAAGVGIRRALDGAPSSTAGAGRLGDFLASELSRGTRRAPAASRVAPAGRVRLQRADGAVVEMDAANVDAALSERDASGNPLFELDTPELEARRAARATYGGRGLEAGGLGALSGATLGLSDVGISALGGGDYLEGLREYNPEATSLGEVVGAVAPVLAAGPLGGGAAAGRGVVRGAVGALGLPTRALAGAAEAVGGLAGRAATGAGASAGRRLLGRAAALGVEGAIEGAGGEAARILSETAIGDGDPDLTAEMVLARLGSGALLGGAVGGALGGAGGVLAEGARSGARLASASSDVIARAWRDNIGTELSPTVARVWGGISGRDPADIRRFMASSEEGRALRELVDGGERVYEDGTAELGSALSAVERARAAVTRRWREGLRVDELERLVDPERIAAQADSARALALGIRDRVETLATDFAGSSVGGAARGLRREIDRRLVDLELAIGRDGARASAEINAALNGIKRDVDALIARSEGMGPAASALTDANDAIRRSLEDANIWGDAAATAQREINEAFARELTTRGRFRNAFLVGGASADGRAPWNPFENVLEADSARVAGFLRGAGTAANSTAETTFRDTVESSARLLDVMSRHLGLSDAERALVNEARTASASALATFDRVRQRAVDLNQWNRLTAGGSDAIGRAVIGGAVGAGLGGPLGAILAGAATNPAGVIRSMATLERWSRGASDEIVSGIRSFLRGAASGVARRGRVALSRARSATTLGGVRAYSERVERLDEERANMAETVRRVSERVAGMDSAPRTRNAIIAATTRGHSYLASVRPRSRAMAGQVTPSLGRAPSAEEMERFLRAARVVDEPLSVLRDLRNGTLTRDSVAALREVYPALYERLVSEVMSQVGQSGHTLDYERRLALGVLLGIPTDPALDPAHMAALQTVLTTTAGPPAPTPSRASPRLTSAEPYGSEALERDA